MSSEETRLQKANRLRAERQAAEAAEAEEREAIDVEAIDELEQRYGDSNVAVVKVPYDTLTKLPVRAAVRTPNAAEAKRYRQTTRLKKVDGSALPDFSEAAEQLASVTVIYPEPDVYAKLRASRPDLHAQLGFAAIKLAQGREEAAGKD